LGLLNCSQATPAGRPWIPFIDAPRQRVMHRHQRHRGAQPLHPDRAIWGHFTVARWEPGCGSVWYSPRHAPGTQQRNGPGPELGRPRSRALDPPSEGGTVRRGPPLLKVEAMEAAAALHQDHAKVSSAFRQSPRVLGRRDCRLPAPGE
jgi:hypothetical protein